MGFVSKLALGEHAQPEPMVMLEGDAGLRTRRPAVTVQRWTVVVGVAAALCAVALSVRHNTANLVDRPNVRVPAAARVVTCLQPARPPLSCQCTDA